MADNTFHCSIVTPERAVLDADATLVTLPAHDGEIGILRGRAPILCQLGIGTLRVETAEGTESFFVDRGFAQMVDNKLTVLTEQARRPRELDQAEIDEALDLAHGMPIQGGESLWADERLVAITRARAQMRVKRLDRSDDD
ncbi:MAG: ATP synthase F1 subunit epsilon [Acidobacteriota bacterium]